MRSIRAHARPALVFALLLGGLVTIGTMFGAAPVVDAQPGTPAAGPGAPQQQPIGMVRIPDAGPGGAAVTFPIVDLQISVENPTTIGSAGGGAGTGKATLNEIALTKPIDAATPRLWQLVFLGTHVQQVQIALCRAGQDCAFAATGAASGNAYLVYTLGTAFLTAVEDGGGLIGGVAAERLTLAVGSIAVQAGTATVCWDVPTNAPCR